jgi:hypothetical protein
VVTVRHFRRTGGLALPVLVLSLIGSASFGAASTFHVSCSDGGPGLATAVAAANSAGGGSIQLDGGCTYQLASEKSGNATGGFNGLPVVTTQIAVDGGGATIAVTGTDFRIFQVAASGNLSLDQLTLTGGNVSESGGGAIRNLGTLSVDRSILTGNSALGGGAIGSSGTATIDRSEIDHNTGIGSPDPTVMPQGGGGIINKAGALTITNSDISWNSAPGGGGIATGPGPTGSGSMTTLEYTTVDHNTAFGGPAFGGGGIANGGTLAVDHGELADNSAPGSFGGGLLNHGVQATLDNVEVTGNAAANDGTNDGFGGGIANVDFGVPSPTVALTLSHVEVDHNFASGGGGGIYNADEGGGLPAISLDHTSVHANRIDNCEQSPSGTIAGC